MEHPIESAEPGADQRAADLRIISRDVSDEEAAAVTAVILASVDEAAGDAAVRRRTRPQRRGCAAATRCAGRSRSAPADGCAPVR